MTPPVQGQSPAVDGPVDGRAASGRWGLAPPRLRVLTPLRVEASAARRGAPGAEVVVTGMGRRRSIEAMAGAPAPPGGEGGAGEGGAGEGGAGGDWAGGGWAGGGWAGGEAVAVMGFAGGLAPELAAGDLVVASEVRGPEGTLALSSAATLARALGRAGLVVHVGPIVSVDHLVRGAERSHLAATGALVVDMESAWLVGAVGGKRAVPLAVVRAVVDTPQASLASPATLSGGIRAYRSLSRAAGVLATWAAAGVPTGASRRVVLAGPRSFCAGVERAIEIVERAIERFGPPVYVRKQIVHNIHVVRDLEARGAIFVDELDQVPDGATVVFSAHGVAPAVRDQAEAMALHVVDATCPLVAKVHAETRRFSRRGYGIVLVGHAGHEEIEGTMGEAPGKLQLVETPADVAALSVEDPARVAYLTQTTLATDEVAGVVEELRARFPDLVGPAADDICYATQNRQEAVRAIAGECELLLVVGSANSSNSNRLVEVARRQGCPARLVDDASQIDLAWLAGVGTVGVTAGASAPESMVDGVVAALAGLGPIEVTQRSVTTESVQFPLPAEVR